MLKKPLLLSILALILSCSNSIELGEILDEVEVIRDNYKYEDWYKLYSNKIKSLQPGLNVFLLHLGYDNEELKGVTIDHPEYGSLWRQLDYDVFNSKEIKKLLKDEGIKLVNWGEIRKIIYNK